MASITSAGLGSGLDIEGIITKLMQVEAQPLTKINTQEASYQSRISALGSLQGAISTFNSAASSLTLKSGQTAASKYISYKASVSDSSVATATATSTSIAGSYTLEVTQLAKAHRIAQTTGYASADAVITQGTLSIQIGNGDAKELVVDTSNATLGGLRDAINKGDYGVTATLTEVAPGDVRLSLASNTTGSDGAITLSGLSGFEFDPSGPSGDFSQATADGGQVAQGAIVKVNGLTITSATNTLSGAIQGVTLTLLKETTSATSVVVSHDQTTSLNASLTGLVKAYNDLNGAIHELGSYNTDTKQAGLLLGDATLRTVSTSIVNALHSAFGSSNSVKYLSDIGVSVQRDGSLTFDPNKLTAAAARDFNAVSAFTSAFGAAVKTLTDGMLGPKGSITAATDGAQASIKSLGKRRTELGQRLTAIEARYRQQFTALDTLIASMNQTSSYLTQQLGNLPGSSASKSK